MSVLGQEERAAADGGTGLDATPVPLFFRGPSRRTGLSASDPDGGWYVREGDHRERGRQGQAAAEDRLGTGSHHRHHRPFAWRRTRLPGPGHRAGHHPARRRHQRHRRPGIASIAARGHKTGWLGYDRAYTQALPTRFHLPARALGYKPVMDYRADQLGIQANACGALLVEGTWYCPPCPGR